MTGFSGLKGLRKGFRDRDCIYPVGTEEFG